MSEEKTKRRLSNKKLIVIVAALLMVFTGAFLYDRFVLNNQQVAQLSKPAVDGNSQTTAEERSVASVFDKVSPSVVSIITNNSSRATYSSTDTQAAGTGIIVSSDGYVLTNRHVVSDAKSVQVVASDGTTYDNVQIVGTDPLNDVAYLKIKDVSGLTAAELGDSSTVRVGQNVVAIGNALGQYQNTVTSGIISGTGRPVLAGDSDGYSVESLTDLFQTDAAINSGNSGGPLLNLAGQVIGINTAVAQNAQGIGFAIPINATKGTLQGVLAGKGVERAYLGVRYIPITPDVAKKYNLQIKQGAYVFGENTVAVMSGGPAEKAGIKEKDIITKIGNLEVGPSGGVSSLVGAYAPGQTIAVTIWRDGSERVVNVTLGKYTN